MMEDDDADSVGNDADADADADADSGRNDVDDDSGGNDAKLAKRSAGSKANMRRQWALIRKLLSADTLLY